MKLIKNIQIYAPDNLGVKDVLISDSKIEKIDDRIELSYPIETIDGTGCILTPGLIDRHVHITGGGGEAGFISRAKPIDVQEILDAEPMIKNPEQGIIRCRYHNCHWIIGNRWLYKKYKRIICES